MSENNQPIEMEEDYEADLLTLEDENGEEHAFEVIDAADFEGKRYMALVPYTEDPPVDEEEVEMLIMRVGEDEGSEYLDIVDDEEELNAVGNVFLARLSEVYNIDMNELELDIGEDEEV